MVLVTRSFRRSKSGDGNYYVVAGHFAARVFRLSGFETIRRLPSRDLSFSVAQQAEALAKLGEATLDKKKERVAVIPLPKAPPDIDGYFKTWPATPVASWRAVNGFQLNVKAQWTAEALYLQYDVRDPTPLRNNNRDWRLLFKSGDAIDLQISGNLTADSKRSVPVAGDIRVLMAEVQGKPLSVLYEPVAPGSKVSFPFASPNRTLTFDRVVQATTIKHRSRRTGTGYIFEAVVPWKLLKITPKSGMRLRGDFGVLFSDEGGENTVLRSHWSNQNTVNVNDIPSEASLEPRQWGEFVLGK